jgi:hypothetical protein
MVWQGHHSDLYWLQDYFWAIFWITIRLVFERWVLLDNLALSFFFWLALDVLKGSAPL